MKCMNVRIKKFNTNEIIMLCLGVLTLIPNTRSGLKIRVILILLAWLLLIATQKMKMFNNSMLGLLAAMILSAGVSCAVGLTYYNAPNQSLVLHEVSRMIVNIMILIAAYKISFSFTALYRVCAFIFAVVFIIQLLQWQFPYQTNDFIRWLYVSPGQEAKHLLLATFRKGGVNGFRAGSIYINPNICAQVIVCCLTVFLLGFKRNKNIRAFGGLVLSFVSLLLCGSRTGFLLSIIIMGLFIVSNVSYKTLKNIILAGGLMIPVGIAIVLFGNLSNQRIFQLSNALSQSLFAKTHIFVEHLESASFLELLAGSLGRQAQYQVDAEWGYVVTYYGIIGLLWYVQLIVMVYKVREKNGIVPWMYPLFIILCGLTCTVFFNLQVSSLYILLALSNYKVDDNGNNNIGGI